MTDRQFSFCWGHTQRYTDPDAYVSDLALSSIWEDAPDADIPQDRIDALRRIWAVAHMSMRDLRSASGMAQLKYADHFCVPRRTVEDWDAGKRTPPDYVRILIARSLGLL